MNTELYVCWHKECPLLDDEILRPINAAGNEGDNIAGKGAGYGELRATYWIWKNSKADVVGLFHYRRFLNLRDTNTKAYGLGTGFAEKYGLIQERVAKLMSEYDVILPKKVPERVKDISPSVYEYYANAHYKEDLDETLAVIAEKYPEMASSAQELLKNGYQSYTANLIIAKKALFDEYAAWLFDILFEVERRIGGNVRGRDSYQRRVYGFLAERLMIVFIHSKFEKEHIKIAEVPLLNIESSKFKYFRYLLRRNVKVILGRLKLKGAQ